MNSKLTRGSLFSGIGGPEIAAEMMGWKNVFHCEINPFGRKILDYWFPNSKSYEDITKTDFTEWKGKINVLTGGFPCFVAGTPILTKRGFLPIDEVRVGDEVLTTDRSYHPVECTMRHTADEIIYMRAQGMYEELKCTPNHPFYVRRKRTHSGNGITKNAYGEAEYVRASELAKGDKVGYPIHEGGDTSFTAAFWKLVGAWIADGWLDCGKRKSPVTEGHRGSRINSYNHKVIICCGKKNISRLHHIIQKAGFKYTLSEERTVFKCIICDKWLCEFLADFGKNAHGKHLAPQCFMLDRNRKKALLEGWFADGYKKSNGAQCVTTVSERLALDMAQIARDVYLCPVSISRKNCKRVCVIEGREVNERPQYCITISNCEKYGFYEGGFVWCNIKSIRREKESNEVFNLSVNEEHSYNVYGIAVHNCQPFSCAGQRKGAEDDRYLWPEMLRAIREIQPDWVVGENVAGILTMVQPGSETALGREESLFGEVDRERILHRQEYVVETVCNDLEREGYSVQPVVIPACAVGAPHRRDRVWFIAHRNDVPHTNLNRCWNGKNKQEQFTQCKGTPIDSFSGQDGVAPDPDEYRYIPRETSERSETGRRRNIPQQEKWRNTSEWTDGFHGFSRATSDSQCPGSGQIYEEVQPEQSDGHSFDSNGNERNVAYSSSEGLSTLRFPTSIEKERRENEDGCSVQPPGNVRRTSFAERWKNFPTQSPICSRDDGIFTGLDGITFSKWRQESIKAYGNAIVPQVMYEIFLAIESIEKGK